MQKRLKILAFSAAIGIWAFSIQAAPSENFKVFLCFGQSNMTGGSGVNPQQIDQATNPRIKVLGFATSSCTGISPRTANKWSDASEPMHCGDGANAVGPSFAFGRAMADSFPNDTIGLIPCGQWGVNISYFQKGGFYSGTKPSVPGGNNVYQWMLTKCKLAQERGVFSGIIMHQGESNTGDGKAWITKVKSIVKDLKADLGLDYDIPFVAGELREDKNGSFNTNVVKYLPDSIPRCAVASSHGLQTFADSYNLHFNQAGNREMGKRMAIEMIKLLNVTDISSKRPRIIQKESINAKDISTAIYSLDGKMVLSNLKNNGSINRSKLLPGNIYIVKDEATSGTAKLLLAPGR